jgi:hypothetical protein
MSLSPLVVVRSIWNRLMCQEEIAVRIAVDPAALWAELKKPCRVHSGTDSREQPIQNLNRAGIAGDRIPREDGGHGETKQVLSRGAGTSGTDGV